MIPGFIAMNGTGTKKGFYLGWLFGALFYGLVTSWFGIFGWEPLVVGSLFFGLYFAIFFIFYGNFTSRTSPVSDWRRFVIPPMLWITLEWLKAQGTFGFPWADLGITQYKFQAVLQTASVFGVYGVSFLLVFFNNLIAETIMGLTAFGNETGIKPWKEFPKPAFWSGIVSLFKLMTAQNGESKYLRVAWIATVLLLPAILIAGQLMVPMQVRVGDYESLSDRKVKVGVAQVNVAQEHKWSPKNLIPTLRLLEDATKSLADEKVQVVIWPETAIPHGFPLNNMYLKQFLSRIPTKFEIHLLTGIVDRDGKDSFNTVILVKPDGQIAGKYNKIQLVPLGEYFPFPESIRKYKIFDRIGSYTHGKEIKVFETPYGNFQPLICFESFFPNFARKGVAKGAQFLVVQTNDAWFLRSNASKLHYVNAIFRAVENRVWVVQCANTGVSGIIDPWGKSLVETDIFTKTTISGEIYPYSVKTLYNRWGNILPVITGIGAIILLFLPAGLPKKNDNPAEEVEKTNKAD
jgi:apolipoprotein N-acyltransferase